MRMWNVYKQSENVEKSVAFRVPRGIFTISKSDISDFSHCDENEQYKDCGELQEIHFTLKILHI